MNLFARKNIDELQQDAFAESEHSLKRELTAGNLVSLGIGAIIGTGIFVLTGTAAAQHAGPAIVLAFVLAGIGCVFAGLCYAEFASMIPIAGSAYTYGYATLGELMAWIIGWDLILEYAVGNVAVAISIVPALLFSVIGLASRYACRALPLTSNSSATRSTDRSSVVSKITPDRGPVSKPASAGTPPASSDPRARAAVRTSESSLSVAAERWAATSATPCWRRAPRTASGCPRKPASRSSVTRVSVR